MRRVAPLTVLLAMACGSALGAQDRPLADLDLTDLMKVEVQSVFGASKFLQKVTEAPATVSVVTARDIALYGYRTLGEILRSAPGFNVTSDRNYSYLGVRGFQRPGDYNSRILILVDGHRMNDPIYNQAYIGTEFALDVELIDRVELIRGPSSSLYGTNAFLAVINVVTKKGESLRGLRLSGDAGSQGTGRGHAAFGVRFDNGLDVMISGSRYASQGQRRLYFPEFDDPSTNNGLAEDLDADATYRTYGALSFKGPLVPGPLRIAEEARPDGCLLGRVQRPALRDPGRAGVRGPALRARAVPLASVEPALLRPRRLPRPLSE